MVAGARAYVAWVCRGSPWLLVRVCMWPGYAVVRRVYSTPHRPRHVRRMGAPLVRYPACTVVLLFLLGSFGGVHWAPTPCTWHRRCAIVRGMGAVAARLLSCGRRGSWSFLARSDYQRPCHRCGMGAFASHLLIVVRGRWGCFRNSDSPAPIPYTWHGRCHSFAVLGAPRKQFDSAHVMGAVPRLLSPRWLRSGSRRGDVAARGVEGGRDEW